MSTIYLNHCPSCGKELTDEEKAYSGEHDCVGYLRAELERVKAENEMHNKMFEKFLEEIQYEERKSHYHTDKCASFSRTECICGVDAMSDFCGVLLGIVSEIKPAAPEEEK